MFAVRANPQVFRQFDFMKDFSASGTFLEKAFRNVTATFSPAAAASWRFFENSHALCARRGHGVNRLRTRFAQHSRAFAQRRTGGKDIVHEKHPQSSHVDPFS